MSAGYSFVRSWIQLLCTTVDGAAQGLVLLRDPDGTSWSTAGQWPPEGNAPTALGPAAKAALKNGRPLSGRISLPELSAGGPCTVVALPILSNQQTVGAVALAIAPRDGTLPRAPLAEVARNTAWLQWMLGNQVERAEQTATFILRLFATALSHPRFAQSATALATELAAALRCERISIGLRKRGTMQVVALSHSADFNDQQNLLRAIAAAMDEAADQAATLRVPASANEVPRIVVAHTELLEGSGHGTAMTIPLARHGRVIGALTLERGSGGHFDDDTLALTEHVAALIAPLIDLQRSAERSLPAHAADSVHQGAQRLFGPGHPVFKLAVAGVAATLLFASVIKVDHEVSAPARLEGVVQRLLVAPADGYVKQALVRPGDALKSGQLLVQLEDRELQLEARKLQGEIAQIEAEYGEALARQDRTKAGIHTAKLSQSRAQYDLVQDQLSRTEIRAPFDGVALKGDLTQSLGAPVKRGETLITVAPDLRHRVIIEVDERDIGGVDIGQTGRLALASAPGDALAVKVTRITPVATARDGRNFFDVEAHIEGPMQQLRPGLEGVAEVNVGPRRLIWVWSHRLVNWVRLKLL